MCVITHLSGLVYSSWDVEIVINTYHEYPAFIACCRISGAMSPSELFAADWIASRGQGGSNPRESTHSFRWMRQSSFQSARRPVSVVDAPRFFFPVVVGHPCGVSVPANIMTTQNIRVVRYLPTSLRSIILSRAESHEKNTNTSLDSLLGRPKCFNFF
jgi:hypothetical protein